jgi:hypothetical protein
MSALFLVIAGLDPAIHSEPPQSRKLRMDARINPAHDGHSGKPSAASCPESTDRIASMDSGLAGFARAPE